MSRKTCGKDAQDAVPGRRAGASSVATLWMNMIQSGAARTGRSVPLRQNEFRKPGDDAAPEPEQPTTSTSQRERDRRDRPEETLYRISAL